MAPPLEAGNWRSIAEQASMEMDAAKLMALVDQLCSALDADQSKPQPLKQQPFAAN
jgi:hypothetical protein